MTAEELLQTLLTKQHGKNAVVVIGAGIAKEITQDSCTVEREGQPILYDVRLQAGGELPASHHTTTPKEGSAVLYGLIGNQSTEAVVLCCSEIDKQTTQVEKVVHEITKDGHLIKKDNETLQKVIEDFISEVQKIIVVQGTSPNVAALEQIKNRMKQLLQ